MRIAIFLFLVLMHCSTLFAYQVKVTKLTDENFDPLPKECVFFMGLIKEYHSYYKDKQIATITLSFLVDEIGKDEDAVHLLAEKEAAKLGANHIYWVSGTAYKDTDQIASSTYRCVRDVNLFLIDSDFRPKQYTENKFEVQKDGKVIYDKATGLMWQQTGSEKYMKYGEASNYISQLNKERFAGYNDWRLPTLKEAITLLKPVKTNKDLFIDPLLDDKQNSIWTSDLFSASSAWVVLFFLGGCYGSDFYYDYYVRAVR